MKKTNAWRIAQYTLLTIASVIIIFPLLFLLVSSLKTNTEIFMGAFKLPAKPNFSHYLMILTRPITCTRILSTAFTTLLLSAV